MLVRIQKLAQTNTQYMADSVNPSDLQPHIFTDLRDNYNKYLQSPGTLIISKSLHEIYKSLNLEGFKEADESINVTKSEYGGPGESENESVSGPIRDFIIKRDNQVFEFQPIVNNKLEQKGFMDNFRASFNNKPNESVLSPLTRTTSRTRQRSRGSTLTVTASSLATA